MRLHRGKRQDDLEKTSGRFKENDRTILVKRYYVFKERCFAHLSTSAANATQMVNEPVFLRCWIIPVKDLYSPI
jgi:hypothetical protein